MRVLAVSWTPLWPPYGGAAVRGSALLERLVGHDVRLVAPGSLPPGLDGVSLGPGRRPAWLPFNPDTLRLISARASRATWFAAREHRPHVVLALGLWAVGMARKVRAPLVLDLSHIESLTAHQSGRPRAVAAVLRWIERRAGRRAAQVWAVSVEDRQRLEALLPGSGAKLRLVPNGAPAVRPSVPPVGPPFRVLFVGRQAFRPNREAARWLVREVLPRLPEMTLTIAGGDVAQGHDRLEAVGLQADLGPLYARSHAVCAPIFSGTGSRLKVLEAAAHRRPLVATRHAVEGHGMEASRHYLRAETAAETVIALQRLEQEPGLAASLAASAHDHVTAHLLWDHAARSARTALDSLVSVN
jgi:glycosyltransferase involved in cell wall biosynthesis